jgi:hypothetical protein
MSQPRHALMIDCFVRGAVIYIVTHADERSQANRCEIRDSWATPLRLPREFPSESLIRRERSDGRKSSSESVRR